MKRKSATIPASKGKFRRDLYEYAEQIIRKISEDKPAYKAVGENSCTQWDRHDDARKDRHDDKHRVFARSY